MLSAGTVTAALRGPCARRRSGSAKGFQSLKPPTTDTARCGASAGGAKVTRTVPSRPGLVVLINCSLTLRRSAAPIGPAVPHCGQVADEAGPSTPAELLTLTEDPATLDDLFQGSVVVGGQGPV